MIIRCGTAAVSQIRVDWKHLKLARILTGLLISTSTEYLYSATGWGKVKGESSNLKHPIST